MSQKSSAIDVFREYNSRVIFEKHIKWKLMIESQWIVRSSFRVAELPWLHFNIERKAAGYFSSEQSQWYEKLRSLAGSTRQT